MHFLDASFFRTLERHHQLSAVIPVLLVSVLSSKKATNKRVSNAADDTETKRQKLMKEELQQQSCLDLGKVIKLLPQRMMDCIL